MSSLLKILPVTFALFIISPVFAQDSAFGNLADEKNTHRTILEFRGVGLNEYRSVRQNYQELQGLYNTAVGTRRDEISGQMTARAKDILTAKLGATLSYLERLRMQLSDSGRVPEGSLARLGEVSENFSTAAATLKPQVDEAETLTELRTLSSQINTEVQTATNESRIMRAGLNVATAEHLIEQIEEKAAVIFAHITSAADLGGDVLSIQRKYDSAMEKLNLAKSEYARINELVSSESSLTSSQLATLRLLINSSNSNLRKAYDELKDVLSDLRVLYSRSPWELRI